MLMTGHAKSMPRIRKFFVVRYDNNFKDMLFTDLRSCTDRFTQTADSLTTAKGNKYVRSEKCEKAAFGDFTF